MRDINEIYLERVLEALQLMGFSGVELDLAEHYFLGETDTLDLGITKKRNAREVCDAAKRQKVKEVFEKMIKAKKNEEMAKFFSILFQAFGVSMKDVFPVNELYYRINLNEFPGALPKAEMIALYAEAMTDISRYRLDVVKNILNMAGDEKKSTLEKAVSLSNPEDAKGRLIIYSVYFYAGLSNDDFLRHYQNIIIDNIKLLFSGTVSEDEVNAVKEYINNDKNGKGSVPENIRGIFCKYSLSEYIGNLFISCAALNSGKYPKLKSFIKVCACGKDINLVLGNLRNMAGFPLSANTVLEWISDFMLDKISVINWCAKDRSIDQKILTALAKTESASFIKAMNQASPEMYAVLAGAANEIDSLILGPVYKRIIKGDISNQQTLIIDDIVGKALAKSNITLYNNIKEYLLGSGSLDLIIPYQEELSGNQYSNYVNILKRYASLYGKDDFYKRCKAYLALKKSYYSLYDFRYNNGDYDKRDMYELMEELKSAGLPIEKQFEAAVGMYKTLYTKNGWFTVVTSIFSELLEEHENEMLSVFKNAEAEGRYMGIFIMGQQPEKFKEQILSYFDDTSKLVREELIDIISDHEEWTMDVVLKLDSKKASERETALMIISKLKGDFSSYLKEALSKEKSKKNADMIRKLLCMSPESEEQGDTTAEDYVKEIHKGGRKKSLAWAYTTPFSQVHFASTETGDGESACATEEYLQAILLSYSTMAVPGINKEVRQLTKPLNQAELSMYVNELFDKWLESGAEAKKKWVLYACAIHGGADIIEKLQHQINDWALHSRGAIAAEAVKAMALSDCPTALLLVDGLARKCKFKQVKTAAKSAMDFAAKELGLSTEELADRIVPDLGFNENMERLFDYGERSFKVYISPALEIEVYDNDNKKLKSMPAPGKRDDEAKASQAYAEFKQMKKQMKTIVANQKMRLEQALFADRRWKCDSWKELFVKNPIMHQFAISLIWGVYEDDKLKDTFRYMEDGSFNTAEEEEFEFPEIGEIGLVHPVELSPELKKMWEEQLLDYEIIQSIEQLKRPVYSVTEEEKSSKRLTRFGGKVLNGLSLSGKLQTMGWFKGSALDGGVFVQFYREDISCNLGVELLFSGMYIGDENDDITVYDACFYRPGQAKWSDCYKHMDQQYAITLGEIPARYFSEIVYQLTKATASSQEKNENWEKE